VNPALRKTRLTALRQFFRFARHRRIVLVDPTKDLTGRVRGFRSKTVDLVQRTLFRRWTTDSGAHPHEALAGLLALLHGASSLELRHLTLDDVDHLNQSVQLGRRPHPTVLDPATWFALQRCLTHRKELRTANPHLIVTKVTKTAGMPASPAYLSHVLDPAGVAPKHLRNTPGGLINDMDPASRRAFADAGRGRPTWPITSTLVDFPSPRNEGVDRTINPSRSAKCQRAPRIRALTGPTAGQPPRPGLPAAVLLARIADQRAKECNREDAEQVHQIDADAKAVAEQARHTPTA
jgi:hypothetical protein